MTVANDIWSVIETSVSVFFVTQIDDWVHYCLMSHPHMQGFKQLLSTRSAPGKPTKIMTKHLAIGFDESGVVPAEEVYRTLMLRGIGVKVPVASVFTHERLQASGKNSKKIIRTKSLDGAARVAALAHLRDRLSKVGRSELLGTFQTFDQNGAISVNFEPLCCHLSFISGDDSSHISSLTH